MCELNLEERSEQCNTGPLPADLAGKRRIDPKIREPGKVRSLYWKPELGLFGLFSMISPALCPTRPCRLATGFPMASPGRFLTPTLTPTSVSHSRAPRAFPIHHTPHPHPSQCCNITVSSYTSPPMFPMMKTINDVVCNV